VKRKDLARGANACYIDSVRLALWLSALAVFARAGQIEAPVSGEFSPGVQSGAVGSSLGAPVPLELNVPSLTGAGAPTLAAALNQSAVSVPVMAAALQPLAVKAAAIPVLPNSVVTPAKQPAPAGKTEVAPKTGPVADAGRMMFDRGPGKVLDPNLLSDEVYSPEIMQAAREAGLVYDLDASSLKKMKPGVEHNFVIVKNTDGTLAMTVGRVVAGNLKEMGIKHVALGEGRAVLFSGGARVNPVTGRPTFDFNSGMYSRVGLDKRWAPTPENARSLAAHAELILKTPVDVVNHFTNQTIDIRVPTGPLRSIVRRGASRGGGWEVDGVPARRLNAGGFKEVLIHPSDQNLVIKLFALAGANDAAGSLSEKRREMRNLSPLLEIGRAPRVVEQGALELQTPSSGGKKITGYIVQERVAGRELGDLLRDPDPAVRAGALSELRALFEDLIAARIKLEDAGKMQENISIGRSGAVGPVKAWVLDAGEAPRVVERGKMDRLLGRPDPLRVHYETVLAGLSRLPRR